MARYALCVGINEFKSLPMSSWLSGCVNDANDISKALKKLGFTARNIRCSRDKEATKKKVMAALNDDGRQGQAGRPPGVHVLQPRHPGAERCPATRTSRTASTRRSPATTSSRSGEDWDRKTVIVDDELRDLFATVPEGVLLEVLLDTCHSGTGLKDLDDIQQAMLLGRRPRFLPPPTPQGPRPAPAPSATRRTAQGRPQGARRADQAPRGRRQAGAVRRLPARPDRLRRDASTDAPTAPSPTCSSRRSRRTPAQTRSQLQSTVTKGLKSGDFEQRSTLEGPAKAKKVPFGQPW